MTIKNSSVPSIFIKRYKTKAKIHRTFFFPLNMTLKLEPLDQGVNKM